MAGSVPESPEWRVPPSPRRRAGAFVALTKPGIVVMVLVTTLTGYFLAGGRDWTLLAWTLLGTALTAAGSTSLNMWWERDRDARMERTRNRPLPAGQVAPGEALAFGALLSVAGAAVLALRVNAPTAWVGVLTILGYLLVYTPMKPMTSWSVYPGAAVGATPPLMGWAAAAGGAMPVEAWALFAILFAWQLPHFSAIARLYREDYLRGGFPPYTASPLPTTFLMIAASLAPAWLGMTGRAYLVGAVALGAAFLAFAAQPRLRARPLFMASIVYLPALLALLALSR